jgi:hypothetical protein
MSKAWARGVRRLQWLAAISASRPRFCRFPSQSRPPLRTVTARPIGLTPTFETWDHGGRDWPCHYPRFHPTPSQSYHPTHDFISLRPHNRSLARSSQPTPRFYTSKEPQATPENRSMVAGVSRIGRDTRRRGCARATEKYPAICIAY